MKILDRYVILSFVKNYLIAFFVLVGMYITMDMVFNFDELVEVQEKSGATGLDTVVEVVKAAGDYYYYQMAVMFVHLSGMIPVVAAAFTLIRLSRFNELSAMLSAGVPLLRVAAPIIFVGVVLNVLMILDQELIIPEIIPKLVRSRQEAGLETTTTHFQIKSMQDSSGGVLNVARYRPGPGNPVMYELTLIERNPDRQAVAQVIAKRAEWDGSGWKLTDGQRISGLRPEDPRKITPVPRYESSITPEEINLQRHGDYAEYLSTRRIDELLDRKESFGELSLLKVKHWRFTQPLVNIILLLLAIPCVITRQPAQLKAAATKCLFLVGACLATAHIAQNFAGESPIPTFTTHWPALMAWTPILIFGPIAVFLLDRVET